MNCPSNRIDLLQVYATGNEEVLSVIVVSTDSDNS